MVQVRILGVALDDLQQHIVLLTPLLEESDEARVLPIWIGEQEATSILIGLSEGQSPRPLSHDLMKTLLDTLGAQVEQIEVTRIEDGTFYAVVTLTTPSGPRTVDARPSDAIALAVRFAAPIFVADQVLEEAGIPAAMVRDATQDEAEDDQRLDEFKQFLENVDPEDFQG